MLQRTETITSGTWRWNLIKLLGSGSTSKVHLAYDLVTGKNVAIKVFQQSSASDIKYIQEEVVIHSLFSHEHIIELENYHQCMTYYDKENNKQNVAGLVVEYAEEGDLLSLLKKVGSFSEVVARSYFQQLISALEYIHEKEYNHRDVKIENLLLDKDFCIKLADFGCAVKVNPEKSVVKALGSKKYYAPEMHETTYYAKDRADLFAATVVLFTIVVGHQPFEKATKEDKFYSLIMKNDYLQFWYLHEKMAMERTGSQTLCDWSKGFKSLIMRMFSYTPGKRPTIEQIKKDKWFKGEVFTREEVKKNISKLLKAKGKVASSEYIASEYESLPVSAMKRQSTLPIKVDRALPIDIERAKSIWNSKCPISMQISGIF